MNNMQVIGKALIDKLGKFEFCYGKGGFWVKDDKFYTLAQARNITGIKATPREFKEYMTPYSDYATIAMINGVK